MEVKAMFILDGDKNNAYGQFDDDQKKAKWTEHGVDHAYLYFGGETVDVYDMCHGRSFYGRFVFTTKESPTPADLERGIRKIESILESIAIRRNVNRSDISPADVILDGLRVMDVKHKVNLLLERLGKETTHDKRQTIRNEINALTGYKYFAPWSNQQVFIKTPEGQEPINKNGGKKS